MPRRSRREPLPARRRRRARAIPRVPAPEAHGASGSVAGPAWTELEGFEVQPATGPKRYRCPWCEGWIEPGMPHVVAFESGRPEDRRHYHSPCWRRYAASARGRLPGGREERM